MSINPIPGMAWPATVRPLSASGESDLILHFVRDDRIVHEDSECHRDWKIKKMSP